MQLKPAVLTKLTGRSRRRLLVGLGITAVAVAALAVSLVFALDSNSPADTSRSPDETVATPSAGDYSLGAAGDTSRASAGLPSYRSTDRSIYTAEAALRGGGPTNTASSTEPEAVGSMAEMDATSETEPPSSHSTAGPDEATSPVGAAATEDTGTTSSTTTTTTAPKITKIQNAANSWTDLRGVTSTTTTTVPTVEGYEVEPDISGAQGSPAVDAFAPGGLDVFVVTGDLIWWQVSWYGEGWPQGAKAGMPGEGEKPGDGSWEGEEEGQKATVAPDSGPASVAWSNGFTDVFLRGADNSLLHRRGTTTWSDWENLGGLMSSDPAVASRAPGLLDVFARGPFGHLWHISFDGARWSDWENLGGDLASEPAAVAMDGGHIDVFARADNGGLLHLAWSDATGWSAWENLGGSMTSGPGVCSLHPGRLDVFARGPNGTLWQRTWMLDPCAGFRKWLPWQDLGGSKIASSPDAAAWGGNRIDVYVRGTDYEAGTDTALWHRWWDGSSWRP